MPQAIDLTSGMIRDWVPVTPNNSTDNVKQTTNDAVVGFYVTGAGAVVFTADGIDRTVTFPANFMVACTGLTRIKATGTTATGIFSLVV